MAREGSSPDGATVVDGGRTRRTVERFDAFLPQGVTVRGIVRIDGRAGTRVAVTANGRPAGEFELGEDQDWMERTFEIPPSSGRGPSNIELRYGRRRRHDVPLLVRRRPGPVSRRALTRG